MQLRVLGCSGGIGAGLSTTALLVDEDILIDAGTGIGRLSIAAMRKIRHIFLTHSHLDHLAGIPLMIDSIFDGTRSPLTLHARAETLQALQQHIFNWVIWPDFTKLPAPAAPVLRFQAMAPGEVITLGSRSIEMIAVNHVVPAAGYRMSCPGGAFAYSGDTTTNDGFWAALDRHRRLDLLVVECAFPDDELELSRLARHYCPTLLADDLYKLELRPEVRLTHLKPGDQEIILRQCREALPELDIQPLQGEDTFCF